MYLHVHVVYIHCHDDVVLDKMRPHHVLLRSVGGDLKAWVDGIEREIGLERVQELVLEEFGWRNAKVVHDGKMLDEFDRVDLETASSVFVIVPQRPFVQETAPAYVDHDQPATGVENDDEEGDEEPPSPPVEEVSKICRICMDSQDEQGNRLFSPCLCKGTMKYVHMDCLQAWRQHSLSRGSYVQCDQCKYEYNIVRTRVARYIDLIGSDFGSYVLSTLTVTLLTLMASEFVQQVGLRRYIFGYVGLHHVQQIGYLVNGLTPERRETVEYYYGGLCLVGFVGGFFHIYSHLEGYVRLRHHVNIVDLFWENPNVLLISASLATHTQSTLSRSLLVVGICYFVFQFVQQVKAFAKQLLAKFGETIVEVATFD